MKMVVQELGEEIQEIERGSAILKQRSSGRLYPSLIVQWSEGALFGALSDQYEADEGDVASHIAKTGNLLRQLEKGDR